MKISICIFSILCGCFLANSIELKCQFKAYTWFTSKCNVYHCYVTRQGDVITDRLNRNILTVSGLHQTSNTNENVRGIHFYASKVLFFPLGLEKLFANLESIGFGDTKLKELRKEDLTPFTNLKCLGSYDNDLEVLEANLFEFNSKLEVVYLGRNKILHIDQHIFDHLVNKLNDLILNGNSCTLGRADNNKQKVNEIIAVIQSGSCRNEAKLKEFSLITTTTTTARQTTTTITPRPTTTEAITTPISSISTTQFEDLKKMMTDLVGDLTLKMRTDKEEIKDEFKKLNDELKGLKDKLELMESKIETFTDQCKASCKNATVQADGPLEARIKFIEKVVGVDSDFHNNSDHLP